MTRFLIEGTFKHDGLRGLLKDGPGTLLLQNNANAYTGQTIVIAGNVELANATLGSAA